MTLSRRVARLEERAQRANLPTVKPVDVDTLAAGLSAVWAAIDAGTFAGDAYHRRALTTLREALPKLVEVWRDKKYRATA